jgi:phenylalanine-4-hydroxylase
LASSDRCVRRFFFKNVFSNRWDVCYTKSEAIYLKFTGPTALAFQNKQISGHGIDYHKDGFGSPVGKLYGCDKPLEKFKSNDLEKYGIKFGNRTTLKFENGIVIEGVVENTRYNAEMLQLISFKDCQVKDTRGDLLFRPEWGTYDMAVGEYINSVFAGTADKEKYNVLPPKSEEIAIKINYSDEKMHLFTLYEQVRNMRNNGSSDMTKLNDIEKEVSSKYPKQWLLLLEILELVKDLPEGSNLVTICMNQLEKLKGDSEEYKNLISDGLRLILVNQDEKEL